MAIEEAVQRGTSLATRAVDAATSPGPACPTLGLDARRRSHLLAATPITASTPHSTSPGDGLRRGEVLALRWSDVISTGAARGAPTAGGGARPTRAETTQDRGQRTCGDIRGGDGRGILARQSRLWLWTFGESVIRAGLSFGGRRRAQTATIGPRALTSSPVTGDRRDLAMVFVGVILSFLSVRCTPLSVTALSVTSAT